MRFIVVQIVKQNIGLIMVRINGKKPRSFLRNMVLCAPTGKQLNFGEQSKKLQL